MSDAMSIVLRYVIAAAVSIGLGLLLRRRAPKARWIYTGLLLATLAIVHPDRDPWLRAIGFCIGIGLAVWDYRRNRVTTSKSAG